MPRFEDFRTEMREKITAIIAKLNAKQLERLTAAMGSPPNLGNVPPALWKQFENEINAELAALLLLLYSGASQRFELSIKERFGSRFVADKRFSSFDGTMNRGRRESLAEQFSTTRAAEVARGYAEHTQNRLAEVPPEQLPQRAAEVLSDKRAEGVATTETSGAIVNAEAGYQKEVYDYSNYLLLAVWKHHDHRPPGHANAMVNPCKICSPLEGLKQNQWPIAYLRGPPAHPRCDCHLEYELITREEADNLRITPIF